jgi:hypothetical protein
MTTREILDFYVELVRKKGQKWYKLTHRSRFIQQHRNSFKRLKEVLDHKEIPIKDYMQVQFMGKGNRPFPNQMLSEAAFKRWDEYKKITKARDQHYQQERYLKSYLNQGYTLEEALNFEQFFWYFRCLKWEHHPEIWKYYAKKELETMPELRDLLKRGDIGKTI